MKPFVQAVAGLILLLSSVCCPSSGHAQLISDERAVTYPAYGMYNGFRHTNIVECSNYSLQTISLTLTLFRSSGVSSGQVGFTIQPKSSFHLILNDAFNIVNDYGMYRIDSGSAAALGSLRCVTVIYRFAPPGANVAVSYSVANPVMSPISGTVAGLFNSFNPVEAGAPPSENYLSIANPGSSLFSATLELYDIDGVLLSSAPVNLGGNQRVDVPVGHINGQVVGLYRIVPAIGTQPFYAFVSVYTRNSADYVYAYVLHASRGSCTGEPLFISTVGPALNWVQVGNPGTSPVNYSLELRDTFGQILNTEGRSVGPRSHEHLLMNSLFGENRVGTVRATCGGGNLLLQGAVYGRNGPGGTIAWGYANQTRGLEAGDNELIAQPLNSFLNVFNWLRTTSSLSGSTNFVAQARTSPVDARQAGAFAFLGGSTDVGLFTFMPPNAVGAAAAGVLTPGRSISSELLRVFARNDGSIGYISVLPPAIVEGSLPFISLVRLAQGFTVPVGVTNAGDSSNRLFVIELGGTIRIISGGTVLPTPFLDIDSRVINGGGERGLLGLAFHPNYETNGRFFVHYNNNDGNSVIAEYAVSGNPNVANVASERILLTLVQPFSNHKGGQIAFGPDGNFYIAFGDGGSGGDPQNNAQNRANLLGDILRIDVNGAQPYAIPADNPFVGQPGIRPEIFAYGFRNPWRFSFDRLNGRLFAGDVGQSAMEEVDIVTSGGNYGWRIMEGINCFNPPVNCPQAGLTLPIHSYGRSDGITVIGGFVYRADPASRLYGKYLFGDFGSTKIWMLEETANGTWVRSELAEAGFLISSFGEDEAGEIYVVNLDGEVYRVTP